jgi:hypothetical protein
MAIPSTSLPLALALPMIQNQPIALELATPLPLQLSTLFVLLVLRLKERRPSGTAVWKWLQKSRPGNGYGQLSGTPIFFTFPDTLFSTN